MSNPISVEKLKEFSEVFKQYDADGNGLLDASELGPLLRSLGRNPSESELQDIIRVFDEDKTGTISLPEFLAIVSRDLILETTQKEIFTNLIQDFAATSGGNIPKEFVAHALASIGNKLPNRHEIEQLLSSTESDIQLKLSELAKLLSL